MTLVEYKTEYNLCCLKSIGLRNRASIAQTGSTRSEETKNKMKEAYTEEKREKIRNIGKKNKGKHLTESHKNNLSKAGKGRKPWNSNIHLPEKMKQKISSSLKVAYNEGRRNNSRQFFDTKPEKKVEKIYKV